MKRVLILLADGFEPMELAGFTDVLGWANIDGEEEIEQVTAGLRHELRSTFGGFTVKVDYLVRDINLSSFDALAIPGGMDRTGNFYDDAYHSDFINVIKQFVGRGQPVAAVCVAGLSLGKAGVINGRRATTYHQMGGKRKAQLEGFGALFIDRPIVRDDLLITSTGPGTAIEIAFALLEDLTSTANAAYIRSLMRVPEPAATWYETPQVAVDS